MLCWQWLLTVIVLNLFHNQDQIKHFWKPVHIHHSYIRITLFILFMIEIFASQIQRIYFLAHFWIYYRTETHKMGRCSYSETVIEWHFPFINAKNTVKVGILSRISEFNCTLKENRLSLLIRILYISISNLFIKKMGKAILFKSQACQLYAFTILTYF